jgi:acetate kinase
MKYILVINSGSATLKCQVFSQENLAKKFEVNVERIGLNRSFFIYLFNHKATKISFTSGIKDHKQALKEIIKVLPNEIYKNIKLVGHRVVHGGQEFYEPIIISSSVIKRISQYNVFAPIHNPINLKCVEECLKIFPKVTQVAVFDTGLFKDLEPKVYLYPLPIKYFKNYGVRKYGFQGLSHQNMYLEAVKRIGKAKLNLITCHLGGGSSVSVFKSGKVMDTTMGFTPVSGLMMLSRSGDIDPFIPLYLQEKLKLSPESVKNELNFNSGFKGLLGFNDMREILIAAGNKVAGYQAEKKYSKNQKRMASLALEMFIYSIQRAVGFFSSYLGKVDAVVFSGGIGERSEFIRQQVLKGVNFINRPRVFIVKADEELMIAKKIIKFI